MIEYAGLLLGLALLIALALRGTNIILASLLASLVVAASNGLDLFETYTAHFTSGPLGAFTFAARFFILFVTGAIFGRAMAESGAAASIAEALARRLGAERALWIVVLACALLTYGGVVVFVVLFAVYPLGLRLIEQAGIPKRLLAAAIGLGAGTFTMTALPGTPSIHNVIAASALGTDLYAGAWLGLVGGALMLALGMAWLERERRRASVPPAQPVGAAVAGGEDRPHWALALVPIAVVLGLIVVPRLLALGEPAGGSVAATLAALGRSQPVAWPSFALVAGSLACLALFPRLRIAPLVSFGRGTDEGLLPLINTAAVIGFGGVVAQTSGFASFAGAMLALDLPPVVSLFATVNVLAGIVGSSSGGLQIFMATLAPHYLELGIEPEVLHRIATMASGGLDSLPHCGTVVALFMIMGLKHREAYKDFAVVTVVVPLIATAAVIAMASLG
ncbi:MAG: hypothetical protein MUC71_03530 [Steroidobacteraceae bacterium]|jgi:H+/gluconate symporter-like permease|nr:hypothetical protein [Steroidobacteraceae bacterium]